MHIITMTQCTHSHAHSFYAQTYDRNAYATAIAVYCQFLPLVSFDHWYIWILFRYNKFISTFRGFHILSLSVAVDLFVVNMILLYH